MARPGRLMKIGYIKVVMNIRKREELNMLRNQKDQKNFGEEKSVISGMSEDNLSDTKLKKVIIMKKALVKILKDSKGNEMSSPAMRRTRIKDNSEEVLADSVKTFTGGTFGDYLKKVPNSQIYSTVISDDHEGQIREETIVTQESNEMIVYRGIIFYKSSATSGGELTKRLNTWIPSLGLDDKSSRGIGSGGAPIFKITKLDRLYDRKFSTPNESITAYKEFLGEDLMNRLHHFNIMLMSAEIGGGFWDTSDGKSLIKHLQEKGIHIHSNDVRINDHSEHTFDLPFEVKNDPNEEKLISQCTQEFNNFFASQGGYLHHGISDGRQIDDPNAVHIEIYKRAQKARSSTLIKQSLDNYILRIEQYKSSASKEIDFSHGFWFFKESRALNRKANYLLAKELLKKLNPSDGKSQKWPDEFNSENIMKIRSNLIHSKNLDKSPAYTERGVNSTELNKVIKQASRC